MKGKRYGRSVGMSQGALVLLVILFALFPLFSIGVGYLQPGLAFGHQEADPAAEHPGAEDQAERPKGVIGVALHVGAERIGDPSRLYVAHVHPEGPAQQAGVAHGDEITAVNGTAVSGKTYEQVVMLIRGEVGGAVTLAVRGESGAKELTITRVSEERLYRGGPEGLPSHGESGR